MDDIRHVLCSIRSCPNLQTLGIDTVEEWDQSTEGIVIRHLKAEQKLEIPLSCCLKNVEIDGFSGLKTHMEFVKLLLLEAVELTELELHFNVHPPHHSMLSVVKRLSRFRRASPKAVIRYNITIL